MAESELTAKQEKTIAALIAQPTIADAARAAGVGERTIYTWLGEEAFARSYRAARYQTFSTAMATLQHESTAAVQVLVEVMSNAQERGATRIAAASKVIEFSMQSIDLEELQVRLAMLEAAYDEIKSDLDQSKQA